MTAIVIIGSIALFFALVLSFSITVYVHITDEVSIKLGAFGFRKKLLPSDKLLGENEAEKENAEKEKEKKAKVKKKKKHKSVDEEASKIKEAVTERTFGETVELVLSMLSRIVKPTKKLLSHIRIVGLSLNMTVCSEDADETAINFGEICTGIYNLLGHLDNLLTLKIKCVNIRPDFVSDEAVYNIKFKVKLRLCHIVGALFSMLGALVCMFIQTIVNNKKDNLKQSNNIKNTERAVHSKMDSKSD